MTLIYVAQKHPVSFWKHFLVFLRAPILALTGPTKKTFTRETSKFINMSVVQVAWALYLKHLRENPLQTKVATGAVLSAAGEAIAQILGGKRSLWRILGLGGYGAVWSGGASCRPPAPRAPLRSHHHPCARAGSHPSCT